MTGDKIAEIRARYKYMNKGLYTTDTTIAAHNDCLLLLAEVERLRADLLSQQGCCDGAAAQDARIQHEREEHKAEVERLRYVLRDTAEDLESSYPTPHKLLAGIIRKALEGAP